MRLRIGFALFLSGTAAFAVEPEAAVDPQSLVQRIRAKIVAHLAQLPNYICHQVIDRSVKRVNSGSFDRVDRLELEVAFLGSRELFARSGEARFEEQPISRIVQGTISNGAFGAHAAALFSGDAASFKYAGTSSKDGHRGYRFDFTVPQEKSHFLVKHGPAEGIVGYKGSFWVDGGTLDLVRLELKADHIPQDIGVRMVEESMRYTMVRIRDNEFLLPRNSLLAVFDQEGNYSLNQIGLERCREFTGESVVTYGTPVTPGSPPSQGSAARQVPEQ